jgi:hypothetical protein
MSTIRWIGVGVAVLVVLCCLGLIFSGTLDTLRGQPPGMLPPVQNTARPMTLNAVEFGELALVADGHSPVGVVVRGS